MIKISGILLLGIMDIVFIIITRKFILEVRSWKHLALYDCQGIGPFAQVMAIISAIFVFVAEIYILVLYFMGY